MYVYRDIEIVNWLPDMLTYFQHPCPAPHVLCIQFSLPDDVLHDWLFQLHCVTVYIYIYIYIYICVCVHLFQPNFTCIYVCILHCTFLYYYHQPPLPLSGMGMMDDVFISAKPYTKVCI